jgi:hypothetical protein
MMKKVCLAACVCTLAVVSAVAFAQTPDVAPLTSEALAAILGPSAVGGSCPTPQSEPLFAARKPAKPGAGLYKSCSATANCASGTVTCSVSGAGGTCVAVDRDCSVNERGHVTCNGVTTNCPTPCCSPPVWCCQCDNTGDCFACCRCDGGGPGFCAMQCG